MPTTPNNEFIASSLESKKPVLSETSNFTPEQAAKHEADKTDHLKSLGGMTKKPNPLMQSARRTSPSATPAVKIAGNTKEGQGR